ncbi:MAG: hypothetical protein EOM68_00145 [Spirochaetia bacterium]|nr:hypothetical protein [Spirochaetia bacterium]
MNDSIRNRVQVALEIQAMLERHTGIKPVIAGGAARDVYYGRVPKDFDIIFPMEINPKDLSGFFASMGVSPRFIPMYDGRNVDRIRGVIKMTYQGIDFDIIFYAIAEDESVTDYFDVNFNQFVLEGHTARFTGDPACWDTHFGGVKYLRQVRTDASDKRMAYIREKFQTYKAEHLARMMEMDL